MSNIFISIASYCDSLLPDTIQDALDNARFPDRLRFGVVEQSSTSYTAALNEATRKQVRLLSVDPKQSRGACWARAAVMSLYNDEEWFFQIDAHTIFDTHWDTCLIAAWNDCRRQSLKPYISGYPHAYVINDGIKEKKPTTQNIIANVVAKDKTFTEEIADIPFVPMVVEQSQPIKGFHLAGGCVFAPGLFVYEVPYDPQIYFHGEEPLLALRAFTYGWDVFHVPKLPVYHYYDTGKDMEIQRVRHWAEEEDGSRTERWWELHNRSAKRMLAIVHGKNAGAYGLGHIRTVEDYAAFSGVDYKNRIIHPKAYVGPWHKE